MSHTPGPWVVLGPWPSIHVGVIVDGGCGCGSGECPEPPVYEPVCCVHQSADYVTEASDECKENARLIAAAPELLEACLAANELLGGWMRCGQIDFQVCERVQASLHDAIRKAKQEDST